MIIIWILFIVKISNFISWWRTVSGVWIHYLNRIVSFVLEDIKRLLLVAKFVLELVCFQFRFKIFSFTIQWFILGCQCQTNVRIFSSKNPMRNGNNFLFGGCFLGSDGGAAVAVDIPNTVTQSKWPFCNNTKLEHHWTSNAARVCVCVAFWFIFIYSKRPVNLYFYWLTGWLVGWILVLGSFVANYFCFWTMYSQTEKIEEWNETKINYRQNNIESNENKAWKCEHQIHIAN